MRPRLAALALLLVPGWAHAYGEPAAPGVPSAEERLLHVLTNQLRQAPHEWPGWDTSLATATPRRPLLMSDGLMNAARFHADDMAKNNFFAHESSDGTPFGARAARYFQGPAGENIFLGQPSVARDAITGWMSSTGHRVNMLTESWTHLGTGFAVRGGASLYVQDFGEARATPAAIPAAGFERRGGTMLLLANYFDPSGAPPASVSASLAGVSIPLSHLSGPSGNETLSAMAALPSGCERLVFTAQGGAGQTRYPTTGALLAGAACTEAFSADPDVTEPGPDVIDANDQGGCRCVAGGGGGAGMLSLLLPLLALLRRRRALTV